MAETIAILAKAPGHAKSRLVPALGTEGAAALQARLIERTVHTAMAAGVGPVTLWAAPDEADPVFQRMEERHGIALARQPDGDLGARMLAAIQTVGGPTLVIGVDCPALTPQHLREAAQALRSHYCAIIPAEDGGYVLIGVRLAQPRLFSEISWSTPTVMAQTRWRIAALKLSCCELPALWDVDTPEDLERARREKLLD